MTQALPCHVAGEGPPLIFLHGWTMDGTVFANQMALLADRHLCMAPDLPGHGKARHLEPRIDAAARALEAMMAERGLSGVTLVGWSMGAAVAWRYLALFGDDRVVCLITVDMSPRMVNDADWMLGLMRQDAASIAANTARFRNDWQGSAPAIAAGMFADRAGPPALPFASAVARIRDNDPAAMAAMWTSLLAADARAVVPTLRLPVLVMHGLRSRVYPAATAQWLADRIPGARRHAFAASGHSPHLEEPEAFASAVAAFAASPVQA